MLSCLLLAAVVIVTAASDSSLGPVYTGYFPGTVLCRHAT